MPKPMPIDNDREVRALALRFAIDLHKDVRSLIMRKDEDPAEAGKLVLADAAAFDAFMRGDAEVAAAPDGGPA